MHNRNVTILYIGGYGRSGSTILDGYLSQNLNAVSLGECVNLPEEIKRSYPCECGEYYKNCAFWSDFVNRFSGLDLNLIKDSTVKSDSKAFPGNEYSEYWNNFISYAVEKSGKSVLIDSSKTTRKTAFRAGNLSSLGFNVKFIYLYKSPKSLMRSLSKGSNREIESGIEKEKSKPIFLVQSFWGWLYASLVSVRYVRFFKDDSLVVCYDDFIKNPDWVVRDVATKFNIGVACEEINTDLHGISGNRVRRSLHGKKIEIVDRDQPLGHEISLLQRLIIFLMNFFMHIFTYFLR